MLVLHLLGFALLALLIERDTVMAAVRVALIVVFQILLAVRVQAAAFVIACAVIRRGLIEIFLIAVALQSANQALMHALPPVCSSASTA
jgi:hypothetical protein